MLTAPCPAAHAACSGDVFRAVLNGNTVCACKIYKFGGQLEGSTSLKRFVREAGMLWRLSTHPNIVRFIGMSVSGRGCCSAL